MQYHAPLCVRSACWLCSLYAASIICLQDHASLCMRPACSICRITLRSVRGCCNRRRVVRGALAGWWWVGRKKRSCLGSVCNHVPDQHLQSLVAWVAEHRIGWLSSMLGWTSECSAGTRDVVERNTPSQPQYTGLGRQPRGGACTPTLMPMPLRRHPRSMSNALAQAIFYGWQTRAYLDYQIQ